MRKYVLGALIALAMPAAAFAQDGRPQGGPPGGMRGGQGRGMMRENVVEWLLTKKDEFRPSGEQVAKLTEISDKLKKEMEEQRTKMQKMREEAQSGGGDRSEMREGMRDAMEKYRKHEEEAAEDALKVLNDEQKKVVKDLLDARKKEMEAQRGRFNRG